MPWCAAGSSPRPIDLVATDAGFVLVAECVVRDSSELVHALRELVVTDERRRWPCSLAG